MKLSIVIESQRLCRKFECREDIHYKTQTETVAKNATGPLDY